MPVLAALDTLFCYRRVLHFATVLVLLVPTKLIPLPWVAPVSVVPG
jgi:hypothetical protein